MELDEITIAQQLKNFENGFQKIILDRPAKINDGILSLSSNADISHFKHVYANTKLQNVKIVKFVPASGAATRMFKILFDYANTKHVSLDIDMFINNINKFALCDEFKSSTNIDEIINNVLKLHSDSPKGLIPFHKYPHKITTAFEEHIVEGCFHAMSNNILNLHFTVSKEYLNIWKKLANTLKLKYEEIFENSTINIDFSVQLESTNTIAVDNCNNIYRDSNNNIIFRPAGHGALIYNLNQIDADLIFIKNIDNISINKDMSTQYNNILAGILDETRQNIKDLLTKYVDSYTLSDIEYYAKTTLNITLQDSYSDLNIEQKYRYLHAKLNRPIRVCGMVKNDGEPGGGPFWVINSNGDTSLQIVESTQIDLNDSAQLEIFKKSTHFNPVDIVCWIKDYKNNKFDLLNYVDNATGIITEKSINGNELKVQELPGLWNGSMSDWITIFVEVPNDTFSPVKTIIDLLKPGHQ